MTPYFVVLGLIAATVIVWELAVSKKSKTEINDSINYECGCEDHQSDHLGEDLAIELAKDPIPSPESKPKKIRAKKAPKVIDPTVPKPKVKKRTKKIVE